MKKSHTHSKSQSHFVIASLTPYSQSTPIHLMDIRAEYDVPRYVDLTKEDYEQLNT